MAEVVVVEAVVVEKERYGNYEVDLTLVPVVNPYGPYGNSKLCDGSVSVTMTVAAVVVVVDMVTCNEELDLSAVVVVLMVAF